MKDTAGFWPLSAWWGGNPAGLGISVGLGDPAGPEVSLEDHKVWRQQRGTCCRHPLEAAAAMGLCPFPT